MIKGGGHGFDEGGQRLSKLGEESAVDTLVWLNDNFPQDPGRAPQSADADVADTPTYSGVPPTTYQARPARAAATAATPTTATARAPEAGDHVSVRPPHERIGVHGAAGDRAARDGAPGDDRAGTADHPGAARHQPARHQTTRDHPADHREAVATHRPDAQALARLASRRRARGDPLAR